MTISFSDSLTKKKAFYAMASKAELTEHKAKIKFEQEPYYMKFIRREDEYEREIMR